MAQHVSVLPSSSSACTAPPDLPSFPTRRSSDLQNVAPAGPVTFVITNAGTMKHELVGFQTNTPAGQIQIARSDVYTPGTNQDRMRSAAIDTNNNCGPGNTKAVTVEMTPGRYTLL